jgi:hypothetical protein
MHEHVRFDMPCIACGYNLRSLPFDGICPECAGSVRQSVEGFRMQSAPPAYVRALRTGLLVTGWGAIALAVTTVLSGVVGALLGVGTNLKSPLLFASALGAVVTCVTLGMMGGVWKLTAQERADRPFAPLHTPRILARASAIVIVVSAVWALVAQLFLQQGMVRFGAVMRGLAGQATQAQQGGGPPFGAIITIFQSLPWASIVSVVLSTIVLTIAWCVGVAAIAAYARWVARRMHDAKLVRLCTWALWSVPIVSVLFACVGIAPFILQIVMAVMCLRMERAVRPLVRVQGA